MTPKTTTTTNHTVHTLFDASLSFNPRHSRPAPRSILDGSHDILPRDDAHHTVSPVRDCEVPETQRAKHDVDPGGGKIRLHGQWRLNVAARGENTPKKKKVSS